MLRTLKKFTKACESLGKRSNRIVAGTIMTGIGFTLIVSGYLPLPKD